MRAALASLLPFLVLVSGCVSTRPKAPVEPATPRIRSVQLAADGIVTPSPNPPAMTAPKGSITASGGAIANGLKLLTERFAAVDSFDLSESRGEVVFSVKRDTDFDIGLVAIEGSDISWIPDDPGDDVAVKWAPKGSKISYIVRTRFGDTIRTLHIPTSAAYTIDFGLSRVHDIAWDPAGERFAVAYSTPASSDAVDVFKYSGSGRTVAIKPAAKLDLNVEPFAGDAIVLQPVDIKYGERLPLVIWAADDRLAWNDERAELLRTARVALAVTTSTPVETLLQRAKETAWIDASRIYLAGWTGPVPAAPGLVMVPPRDIESSFARFIAEHLKRNPPTNGDSPR